MSATGHLYSAWHYKVYTSFVADIDLRADGPNAGLAGDLSRRFTILGGGTLVVARGDAAATNVTITGLVAGQVLDIQAAKIVSAGTSITSVLVHW
jgi:hypothetical protein